MNELKRRAVLYIPDSLMAAIILFALHNRLSWDQAATALLKRGLEAQPTEDDDRESIQRASAAFDELVGITRRNETKPD